MLHQLCHIFPVEYPLVGNEIGNRNCCTAIINVETVKKIKKGHDTHVYLTIQLLLHQLCYAFPVEYPVVGNEIGNWNCYTAMIYVETATKIKIAQCIYLRLSRGKGITSGLVGIKITVLA